MIEIAIGIVAGGFIGGLFGYHLTRHTMLTREIMVLQSEIRELQYDLDAEFNPEYFAKEDK